MNKAYLLLGSNDGDRNALFIEAERQVSITCGAIVAKSFVYETAAWGMENQAAFLNKVIEIATLLPPVELLAAIQRIEDNLGRKRDILWGPRTLDIDILFYNDDVITLPHLKVPHPFLQKRRFTLVPIADIAPDMIHPVLKKSVRELLASCTDPLEVGRR